MINDLPEALRERLATVGNIRRAAAVLEWDLQTHMPPGGAAARAEQLASLSQIAHEMFTSEETGKLIAQAEGSLNGASPDSDEARYLKNARRDYDLTTKIPVDHATELARHSTLAQDVWQRARAANDFASFAPYLEKTFELSRRTAELLGYQDDPYDALLDQYEEGAKTAEIEAMFANLRPHLVRLVQCIVKSPRKGEDGPLTGPFAKEAQSELTKELVKSIGYDFTRGRQDQAAHPFCTGFTCNDIRITTRFNPERLEQAVYASLHEAGHAMYEQGSPVEYDNTPLGGGVSMGIHESQSRMWENLVGRSRAFVNYALPQVKAAFPQQLSDVTEERFYRAVNCVEPSLIRVEADEVTYNLHVLLRFELERELLSERLKVADLPAAWAAKMEEYLGITPPDDARGVLQDVHWSGAMVGYFPTYTLGNIVSGHLWHAIQRDLPELDSMISRGEFAPLLGWLRENVHRHGRKYKPNELIERATGEPLNPTHYINYLNEKYTTLYDL